MLWATLPLPHPQLFQSTFASTLDQMHNCRMPDTALLANKIAWSNAMWFFSYGDMLWTYSNACAWAAKMNRHCNLINQSWHFAAGIGRNRLSPWHPPCHKGWTHRALMRYEQKTCRISLSSCMSCVTILSAIQMYQFYEMYQGIKNNPVRSLGIVKLCM